MDATTEEARKVLCGAPQVWLSNPWGSSGEKGSEVLKALLDVEKTVQIDTNINFGHPMRAHFRVGKQWHYLNHGSYGAVLRVVHELKSKIDDLIDENPNAFFDDVLGYALRRVASDLAAFINCDPDSLVLIPNATTAISTVLRSISWTKEGKPTTIILTNFTYGAVKKQVHFVGQQQNGPRYVVVDLQGVLDNEDEMAKRFETAVEANPDASLAVLDHIISETATVIPLHRILPILKKCGIRVLVDGAHALGRMHLPTVPIDLRAMDVDFYCSNAHKWLCAKLGTAFLYVAPKHQSTIRPLVISHGYSFGFLQEFAWTGSNSYSEFLSLTAALSFFRAYGTEKIMKYNHTLARKIGEKCAARWSTSLLCDASAFASMISVRLPSFATPITAGELRTLLRRKYNIEVPIIPIGPTAQLYVRISAQIYMEENDYDILIDTIIALSQAHESPKGQ